MCREDICSVDLNWIEVRENLEEICPKLNLTLRVSNRAAKRQEVHTGSDTRSEKLAWHLQACTAKFTVENVVCILDATALSLAKHISGQVLRASRSNASV